MRLRRDAKRELLKRVPLFGSCSKTDLDAIGRIADELDLPAGRTLIREGARGREFFALAEGEVEVRRQGRKVATMRDGDFFGEIALLADTPRTSTVTTTTPVRLLVITDRAFARLLESEPRIRAKVLEAVAARLAPETV